MIFVISQRRKPQRSLYKFVNLIFGPTETFAYNWHMIASIVFNDGALVVEMFYKY